MDDDAATQAAWLTAELLIALEEERALNTDLAVHLEAVHAVLSEALTLIARQARLMARRSRPLPVRLADCPDVTIPAHMVRAQEIRWTPDGR